MKKFLLIIALVFIAAFNLYAQDLVSTEPQFRNAILEEFTGIYCGYCPQGHAIAQGLIDDYPGRVFAINVHAGSYAAPQSGSGHPDFRTEWGDALVSMSGLTGYPAGQVNREYFNGASALAMNRGSWAGAVSQVLIDATMSPVNIGAKTVWNADTRNLSIQVEAYFTSDADATTKLNIAFLESGVVGYQASGGEDYVHNHILRDLITGQWGEELTETTEGSLFQKTYEYTVSEDWVIDNCDIVIFMTQSDNKYIYTGIEVPAITPNLILTQEGDIISAIAQGSNFAKAVEVANTTEDAMTFTASVALSKRSPADWSTSLEGEANLTVAAGEKVTVNYNLTPGATIGIGDATLTITETNVENPLTYTTSMTAVSKEVEFVELNAGGTILDEMTANDYNVLSLESADLLAVADDLENLKAIMVSSGTRAFISLSDADMLVDKINQGVGLLMTGSATIAQMIFDNPSHQLLSTLGVTWDGSTQLNTFDNTNYTLTGMESEPLVTGMEFEFPWETNGYALLKYSTTNLDNVSWMFDVAYTNDQGVQKEAVIGQKIDLGTTRHIHLGFTPACISDSRDRENFIDRCMTWILEGASDVNDPIVSEGNLTLTATPNPCVDMLNIAYTNEGIAQNMRISIVNELGQEVALLQDNMVGNGTHNITYDASQLSSGVYFINIKTNATVLTKAFVKN